MKTPKPLIRLGCLILTVSVSIIWLITQPALAQEITITCNLPESIAITFLDSKCTERTLEVPETFYRYYSDDNYRLGRYLTTDKFELSSDVIRKLALKQEWGNKATTLMTVILPKGTIVYQGIAAPQLPDSCYPGGGQQIFISDSRNPEIQWSEGQAISIEDFLCETSSL